MTRLLTSSQTMRGFTIVELAIVLIIVSLLAGGMMMTLGAQIDQRNNSDTQRQMQEIREALLGYAAIHNATADGKPYLPCPDTDGNGTENRLVGGACTNQEGILPWADLGLARQDAWGNKFRYRVHAGFSNQTNGFTLSTTADFRICEEAACATVIATAIPALVISHGKNGLGATNVAGAANALPVSADELENTDGDKDFVLHTPTPIGTTEFDDLVTWLSPNILYNRMIAAGKLP